MMRVTTFNCNGVRAAQRRGFFCWLERQQADVLCLQETRAGLEQLRGHAHFFPPGYHCYYAEAERKGYAGTAIYTRQKPDRVIRGFGWPPADSEGRYIQADFGELSVISLYMPSGAGGEHRQAIKLAFLEHFERHLRSLLAEGRHYIICGDWNMCHREIDLRNWRANQNKPGFMPVERAWLDRIYGELGFCDAFRQVDGREGQYTWWSMRGRARADNVGWRIDYHVVSPGLRDRVRDVEIETAEQFSDHAPVTQCFDWMLYGQQRRVK
jgi:exodeoxyribonuclease-3